MSNADVIDLFDAGVDHETDVPQVRLSAAALAEIADLSRSLTPFPRSLEPTPCRDGNPEQWFDLRIGTPAEGRDIKITDRAARMRAKELCDGCPILTECLDWALSNDQWHGVYGGMTGVDRKELRRQRQRRRIA